MGKVLEFKIKTRPLATDPAMTVVDVTGGLNPHMTKIFEIAGPAKAFTILRTEEEAGKK